VFLYVYIAEAHAADEWPFGPTLSFCNQPKTIQERCELASDYVSTYGCQISMLVDTMENQFENVFAAWPLRYYVIQNGRLAVKAQPDSCDYTYSINELASWLEKNVS